MTPKVIGKRLVTPESVHRGDREMVGDTRSLLLGCRSLEVYVLWPLVSGANYMAGDVAKFWLLGFIMGVQFPQ